MIVIVYAAIYSSASVLFETILRFAGLSIPDYSNLLAILLLTLIPAAAAWIAGFHKKREFIIVFIFTGLFTLLLSELFDKPGILRPLVIRALAGAGAAALACHFIRKVDD